jgi:hypothetical protein
MSLSKDEHDYRLAVLASKAAAENLAHTARLTDELLVGARERLNQTVNEMTRAHERLLSNSLTGSAP